jgi:hypothetical protein
MRQYTRLKERRDLHLIRVAWINPSVVKTHRLHICRIAGDVYVLKPLHFRAVTF